MRSRLGTLAMLALCALSCGTRQQPSGARAAAAVLPREAFCGENDCSWILQPGSCQAIADWLSIPGVFSDVRISQPVVGLNAQVADGVTYTVNLDEDLTTFDWTATGGVDLVVASSVFDSNVYEYVPAARGDAGLAAYAGSPLTQVLFCLKQEAATAGCTLTQGYWKTHSRQGPAPYDDRWQDVGALEEQTVFFLSGRTWLEVFETPVRGSAYDDLAHQYMAAKLNVLAGASADVLGSALATAEAFFGANTPASALTVAQKTDLLALAALLDDFNNGRIGPGHCP